jgi:regulator of protease activity HflC (stomatin/prohibitin superfamily)
MKRAARTCALAAGALLLAGCVPHTTGETEVGVRTVKFGFGVTKTGVEDKAYPPGSTYFFAPLVNDWSTFDTKLQNMEMTIQRGKGDRVERDDLLFKTIDGNDIGLDVIIAYRLDPAKAPHVLQYVAKDDEVLRDKIVRTVARSKPRDVFGELKTEEFYVASRREEKSQEAKERLQEILAPMGIIVEKVLTKDYRFNPEYQKAIEAKKVADQRVEKNKSAQHAALEEYKKKLQDAEGDVNKMVARADGDFERAKIEADAYHAKQEMLAQAIRAEGEAAAKGIREKNRALAGAGGETLVKLKIAEAMKGKKIILLPVSEGGMNLKTTDMNGLLKILGVQSAAGGGAGRGRK